MNVKTAGPPDEKAIFHFFSRAFRDDPSPAIRRLRERGTIFKHSVFPEFWITGYAAVSSVLRDRRFSVDSRNTSQSRRAVSLPLNGACFRRKADWPISKFFNTSMVYVDQPLHQALRRFFSPLFSPSNMNYRRDRINLHVADLVDRMRGRQDPDIIRDLALPLPVLVIAEVLGIPPADTPFLQRWADHVSRGMQPVASDDAIEAINDAAEKALSYMTAHVDRMRKMPAKQGYFNPFAETPRDASLTSDELAVNCLFLFGAGFETIIGGIGNGTLALLRHPEELNKLRRSPGLAGSAVDELLRYDGPVRFTSRYALEDVDVEGMRVRRGDTVHLVLSAANHDPLVFTAPDQLDVARIAKHQVAFAQGPHFCLGAPLARIEIESAITAIASLRFSAVHGGCKWNDSLLLRHLDELRIRFH